MRVFILCFVLLLAFCGAQEDRYLKSRDALVEAEFDLSLAADVTMTEQELIANEILANLLVKEAGVMGDHFPPAINFFKAHDWILNTSILFPLIQAMPKGVIHHLHFDSSATYDWIIANVTYSPNCYMYQGENTDLYTTGAMRMWAEPPSNEWIGVNTLRQQSGNSQQFDEELLVSLTMQNIDFGDYVALWNKFDDIFNRVGGLVYYKDCFEGYFEHMVSQMMADGVQNIEVKVAPELVLYDLDSNIYNFDYVVQFVYGLINRTKQIEPSFTLKLVMSDVRNQNYSTILPLLQLSLEYRNKFPDLVVGFDLVGPEDEGHTLLYFLDDFLAIANTSKYYTYQLPYYFHAGETLMANNTNLFDAVLLNCYRIGHAFQLAKHPLLTEIVVEMGIGLEICPVSNQILQYCYDLRLHPGFEYFNRGLNITISPDDPAIYGYGGVSFDWYEITLAWALDIPGLKQLALNSYIKGSFFTEEERITSQDGWQAKWDTWIDWVVATYG